MKQGNNKNKGVHYFFLLFVLVQFLAIIWTVVTGQLSSQKSIDVLTDTDAVTSAVQWLNAVGVAYILLLLAIAIVAIKNIRAT